MPGETTRPEGLLTDVRVIEVALLAPSALGGHLAELGADVIKVEPGAGDYVRSIGRRPGQRGSDMHQVWNRGKRSVALDLDSEAGRRAFLRLAAGAEVVIEGRRPGYLDRRGLGYEDLLAVNPSLVFTCLSGFGESGPYRDMPSHGPAFDAYAGLAPPVTDERGRPRIPRPGHLPVGVLTAPLYAATATLAAVLHARATGRPTRLDVAQADAAVHARSLDIVRWRAPRTDAPADPMTKDLFHGSALVQYYRTADGGHVLFQAMERKFFERFAALVGRPELAAEFPAGKDTDWLYGRDDVRAALAEVFARETSAYWVELCLRHDIPCTPVNAGREVLDDPQFRARTRWLPGEGDEPSVPALPVRTTPPLPGVGPAPELGRHTTEVLAALEPGEDLRVPGAP